ncbi:MAG: hypothetical protein DSY89_08275 [Deltaproteobacteria bacterium]|nr:MAG: hypothetical protein DSY89_08275 [Deltaproteobacteria bacterium]
MIKIKSFSLFFAIIFVTLWFLVACDGVDLTGCDCDKEISDLEDSRGKPDEKELKFENGIHTLTYRYYSDGYVHSFVWGKNTERCCDETFSTSGNTAPVALGQSIFTQVNQSITITLEATDAESDPIIYEVINNPTHGNLNGAAPALTYQPHTDFIGKDSFQFRANDGKRDSNVATIDITITASGGGGGGGGNPNNSPPVARNQTVSTKVNSDIDIILTATDADNDTLSYRIVNSPANGRISGTPPDITYSPDTDFTGSDEFTFRANDGTTNSNTATISILVEE